MTKSFFTNKQLTIIICVVFVTLAVMTMVIDGNETSEGQTVQTEQESEQKDTIEIDSVVVNKPLDTDPYEELDNLIGLDEVKKEVKSLASNFRNSARTRGSRVLSCRTILCSPAVLVPVRPP